MTSLPRALLIGLVAFVAPVVMVVGCEADETETDDTRTGSATGTATTTGGIGGFGGQAGGAGGGTGTAVGGGTGATGGGMAGGGGGVAGAGGSLGGAGGMAGAGGGAAGTGGGTGGSGGSGGATGPGSSCADPSDVSAAVFPVQLTGSFTDDPSTGASCDATPTNAVWFAYTPTTDGWRDIQVQNHTTTTAFSRLAVLETAACGPYGQELGCSWSAGKTASARAYLQSGTTYLILFHTDGPGYSMVDPEIDIAFVASGSGQSCAESVDLSTAPMPLHLAGSFDGDPTVAGTCDATPFNAAWFTYTPTATDFYRIQLENHAAASVASRLAVFATSACSPYGAEQACVTSTDDRVGATIQLDQGTTYLIVYHTDADAQPTVAPEISVAPSEGDICANPADVSSVVFPYEIIGDFEDDPTTGASCDTTATNTVWYSFTPTVTDWYEIELENFTSTSASSRVAVFETLSCDPYGTPLACETPTGKQATALVNLSAGQPYLIMFFTSGASYSMVDPQIDIHTAPPPPPGDDCALPATVGATNHYVGSGSEDCWTWSQDTNNDVNDHTFSCDGSVGGDVVVEYTTGPAQTTLNFDATISNYQSSGYIGLQITNAPCIGGSSLHCISSGTDPTPLSDSGAVTVTPSTAYYVWICDGFSGNYVPDIDVCLW